MKEIYNSQNPNLIDLIDAEEEGIKEEINRRIKDIGYDLKLSEKRYKINYVITHDDSYQNKEAQQRGNYS